jgi:hypothetical protein
MKPIITNLIIFLIPLLTMTNCKILKKEVPLQTRVTTYWKIKESGTYTIKINGKHTSLYQEYLSNKSKKYLNEKKFYSKLNGKISNVSIDNIVYKNENTAIVSVKYNLNFNGYNLKGIKTKEKWIKENGKWVIVININSNPFWRTK